MNYAISLSLCLLSWRLKDTNTLTSFLRMVGVGGGISTRKAPCSYGPTSLVLLVSVFRNWKPENPFSPIAQPVSEDSEVALLLEAELLHILRNDVHKSKLGEFYQRQFFQRLFSTILMSMEKSF